MLSAHGCVQDGAITCWTDRLLLLGMLLLLSALSRGSSKEDCRASASDKEHICIRHSKEREESKAPGTPPFLFKRKSD